MRKRCVGTFLILALLQTGLVDSKIAVTRARDGERLSITCHMVEKNNTISQINWEMINSSNSTTTRVKLGAFHPEFGIYVAGEYNNTMKIQGDISERSSTVYLENGVNPDSQLCCIFHTFPSGVLEECADSGARVEAHGSGDPQAMLEARQVEQWALLVGGCTVCFFSVALSLYYSWRFCCRHCCNRRRTFKVETCLTDQHTDSERITDDPPHHTPRPLPPVTQPQGFDPSKLYAKIKLDLLYGRLWKAYNGASRTRAPSTQQDPQHQRPKQGEVPGPEKVYSLLWKHRGSQIKEAEEPDLKLEPESAVELEDDMEAEPQPTQEGSEKPTHGSDSFPPHALDLETQ